MTSVRPRRASSPDARPTCWSNGQMFQDACHVCIKSLPQKLYDWDSIDNAADDISTYGMQVK